MATTMTGPIHDTIRQALERARGEAEDNAYRWKRQNQFPDSSYRDLEAQAYWDKKVADATSALEWLHGEFYNEVE